MEQVIGRFREKARFQEWLTSEQSELAVVYGRRRVGKTFLITTELDKHTLFGFTGTHGANLRDQLGRFHKELTKRGLKSKRPKSWFEAFDQLEKFVSSSRSKKKKVLFFDEFPWLDGRRSKFLMAFGYFWNMFASKRKDLLVVVCGSAASYMVKNVIRNRGGLHNRVTQLMRLEPFNLAETELMLKKNNVNLTRMDIARLYMCIGGIPFYLKHIKPGESVAQAIDRLCFENNGLLRNEFQMVFASLFEHYQKHEAIVRALSTVRRGLTRSQVAKKSKVSTGGTLTKTLRELEQSSFIERVTPYRGVKDSIYRLADEYCMFYLKYIEGTKPNRLGHWNKLSTKPTFKSWAGFSFETLCLKHGDQIKSALNISGISSVVASWIEKNTKKGAQIDLLIDRADDVINLCEMKFNDLPFKLTKGYAMSLREREQIFRQSTRTKKSIFITFITANGLEKNEWYQSSVQNHIELDALFKVV